MHDSTIQMRIPRELKGYLKSAAFDAGMTATAYVIRLLEKDREEKKEDQKDERN